MLFFLEDKKLTRFAFLVPLSTEPICLFFCLFSVPLKKNNNSCYLYSISRRRHITLIT